MPQMRGKTLYHLVVNHYAQGVVIAKTPNSISRYKEGGLWSFYGVLIEFL